jgi:rare lipoprotein A
MPSSTRPRLLNSSAIVILAVSAAFLASCTTSGSHDRSMTRKTRSKEYFSEAQYGVKASPRVSNLRTRLPRGGGRDQLGKPYKVAGKWYYPKEDRHYRKVGAASWYGDAFHGRLTANGEVYDMTHLTAAHPTMPLPSYARVTNLNNGSSVIVRVNDRGPYARGRIIDLSKRAAEMLDYAHGGVAKVKVEYVGRAPLDGHDDSYLLASYHPGKAVADPSDGLATGVMVAMNGPSPSRGATAAMPGVLADSTFTSNGQPETYAAETATPVAFASGASGLPAYGPISPERPELGIFPEQNQQVAMEVMGYADRRVKAAAAFAAFDAAGSQAEAIAASWKSGDPAGGDGDASYVAAGTFADRLEAERIAAVLGKSGKVNVEKSRDAEGTWYSVEVRSDGRRSLDDILEAAWMNGASDAMTVRE